MYGPIVDSVNPDSRKRRGRLAIMAEILQSARHGVKKTQIMYKANLSFAQLEVYLSELLDIGLLKILNQNNPKKSDIYKTSGKGLQYLRAHNEIMSLLEK